jgi:signal transduction histidine kinase/ActR/RegA family two-component response regulator
MFFLDNTGFFSLVSLIIQCLLAWVFSGFLVGLRPPIPAWLVLWRAAFLAYAVALTAICVRFMMAHHHISDIAWVAEGAPLTAAFYHVYLGGKLCFVWLLVAGIANLEGAAFPRRPFRALPWLFLAAGLAAFWLPNIECLLLVQAPLLAAGFCHGARLLVPRARVEVGSGARTVVAALWVWAALWLLYGISVLAVGPLQPVSDTWWNLPLRVNSMLDLVVQVVLATGLLMLVLHHSRRQAELALQERDRLRAQLQRDEELRAMTALVSGVAHEINNPLTAILGHIEEMQDEKPELRNEAIQVVREQAERCRKIVQRLSLLARRAPPVRQSVDLPALLRRVAQGFQPQFTAAGVKLHTVIGDDLPRLPAEPTALEQVVTNLLANALQASAQGQQVTLAAQRAASGMGLEILIDDEGPGVPLADRQRIFEPFWTTKRAGQGTGLGLAVVRSLVTAHGGAVRIEASPGGGARFIVWLPLAAQLTASPVPVRTEPETPLPAGQRLLVIDDEPVVRSTVARQAARRGWLVHEAATAEDGLALLRNGTQCHAVLCDLRMPGIGGIGFHDRLLAESPALLDRVVFVTGDLTSPEATAFAARCKLPILTKPFELEELWKLLRARARQGS